MKRINLRKKIMIIILAFMISLSLYTPFASANNENQSSLQYELGVKFEQDTSNEKLIHVILEMSNEDSISSFNISADIDVEEEVQVEFTFNDNHLPDVPNSELRQQKIEPRTDVDGKKVKELNIYYVGTKELNPEDSNRLEVGTLEFKNVNGDNTTIKIDSVENKSAISTISYKSETLNINGFSTVLNKKDTVVDDEQENGGNPPSDETGNGGESQQGGSNSGTTGGNSSNGNGSGNNNGGNGNKPIGSVKTGANKSVTWAIVLLAILIPIAIVLIQKKKAHNASKRKLS